MELAVRVRPHNSSVPRTERPSLYLVPGGVFLVSRVLFALLGAAAPHLLPAPRHANPILLPHGDVVARLAPWLAPWFRFDSSWYVSIAQHGYHWGRVGVANTNFFPLYPLLIRIVQPLTLGSPWLAALLVASLASLAATILLWRWALGRWDRQTALAVVLLVVTFPFAFFYAAPYAEGLFLLFAVAAFLFLEEGRWGLATGAAALAVATRPTGPAVVLALVLFALARRDWRRALLSLTALLPLFAFMAYLALAFGHPFAFLTYHTDGWVTPHGGLVATLESQFHTPLSPFDRVDAAVAVAFLGSGLVAFRRLGPTYGGFVLLGAAMPLVHGLAGMERYAIVLFPAIAVWAAPPSRALRIVLFPLFLFLLVVATVMFTSGYSIT